MKILLYVFTILSLSVVFSGCLPKSESVEGSSLSSNLNDRTIGDDTNFDDIDDGEGTQVIKDDGTVIEIVELPNEYDDAALALLKRSCNSCHNANLAQAGIGYIMSKDTMIQRGIFKPGSPSTSTLFTEIDSGDMPIGSSSFSSAEVDVIRNWIDREGNPKTETRIISQNSDSSTNDTTTETPVEQTDDVEEVVLDYGVSKIRVIRGGRIPSSILPEESNPAGTVYSISPALPCDLTINSETGGFEGRCLEFETPVVYTITASFEDQTATDQIEISVVDFAPTYLTYIENSLTLDAGFSEVQLTPSVNGGVVTEYLASPTLPAGLTLNSETGILEGIPTTPTTEGTYTITAKNSGGESTFDITITVVEPPALLGQNDFLQTPDQNLLITFPDNGHLSTYRYEMWDVLPAAAPTLSDRTFPGSARFYFHQYQSYLNVGAGILLHYVDSDNYYEVNITSADFIITRKLNGVETEIYTNDDLAAGWQPSKADWEITTENTGSEIKFNIKRGVLYNKTGGEVAGSGEFQLTDSDTTAVSIFSSGGYFGFFRDEFKPGTTDPNSVYNTAKYLDLMIREY
jgi:hypothetical protein